jgi:hypothetical protein
MHVRRSWRMDDGLNMGEVTPLEPDDVVPVPAECAHLQDILRRVYPELGGPYEALPPRWDDAGWVANRLAEILAIEAPVRQRLLEVRDPAERLRALGPLVRFAHTDA